MAARAGRGQAGTSFSVQIQRAVLGQDGALQARTALARLQPEFLDKGLPGFLKGFQRLDLARRPVKREHVLGAEDLAERVLLDQLAQLADEGMVAPSSSSSWMHSSRTPR